MTENEMHIGPYLGREAGLYRFSRGLVSNGMEYPESSKIAFAAIAEYLWNPDDYEPELSWKRSIRALVGEEACGPFLTVADNLRFSCLYPFDSPELSERLHDFIFRFTQEDRSAAAEELKAHIAHMEEALRQLRRLLQDHPILSELSRWLNKYSAACRLLGQCVTYLLAASKEKRDALSESFEQFRGDRTQIFADVVESFVQQVLDGEWFDDET